MKTKFSLRTCAECGFCVESKVQRRFHFCHSRPPTVVLHSSGKMVSQRPEVKVDDVACVLFEERNVPV